MAVTRRRWWPNVRRVRPSEPLPDRVCPVVWEAEATVQITDSSARPGGARAGTRSVAGKKAWTWPGRIAVTKYVSFAARYAARRHATRPGWADAEHLVR